MKEPLTPLQESAANAHEVYETYVGAGFSEDQAMQIVTSIVRAAFRINRED